MSLDVFGTWEIDFGDESNVMMEFPARFVCQRVKTVEIEVLITSWFDLRMFCFLSANTI